METDMKRIRTTLKTVIIMRKKGEREQNKGVGL